MVMTDNQGLFEKLREWLRPFLNDNVLDFLFSWKFLTALVIVVFVVIVWTLGRKAARQASNDFYNTLFADLQQILCDKTGISSEEAHSLIDALKKQQPETSLPDKILRVEYALARENVSTAKRILAVLCVNSDGQPELTQIEREYDWDFIPDELASQTIRAGKPDIHVQIYLRK